MAEEIKAEEPNATVLYRLNGHFAVRKMNKYTLDLNLPISELIFSKYDDIVPAVNGFSKKELILSDDNGHGYRCNLYYKNFTMYSEPRKISEKSAALYLGEMIENDTKHVIQLLNLSSKTTEHHHKKTIEVFYPLHGSSFIYYESLLNPSDKGTIALRDSLLIPVNTWHILSAIKPVLNVIGMHPVPNGIEDHYYS
jgi:mannose-6-phosphate isomerase-like protein (cupin superfamily)